MGQTLIYVSCATARAIDVFVLDMQRGTVSLRQRLDVAGGPLPLRVSRDGRLLLAGLREENALLTCSIDPASGTLAVLGRASCAGVPTYVSCDAEARVAFIASYRDNLLAVFPLDGGRPLPPSQVESGLPHAHAALTDASNRWLLVPTLGADAIRMYRLGSDASISPRVPPVIASRPGSGPRHLVFGPGQGAERYVHCLNELDGSVDLFAFDADKGRLELRQSVSMMPPGFTEAPWAAELRATPDGAFLFATDRRSSTLAVFSVDRRDGRLSPFGHYPTEAQPRGMGIDATGRWLAVAGQLSSHLTVYALDPQTGLPTLASRLPTGDEPICVEFLTLP